ncbi:MAG: G-D-S-L family lipolytic protein [Hymenobacter sp.]|nr:MAG: G-D-S-L family lipolytic protein [Hymenobacter sp.]
MMKHYLNWAFAAVICSLAACVDKDIPDPAPPITSGTANFSRYIAVGTSLAAGYTNGGLYQAGQAVAYPNLLAGQFALAGGGSFISPLFPADQPNGTGYLKLTGLNSDGTPIVTQVAPQSVRAQTTIAGVPVTLYTKYTGELNNYGVPGIKVANVPDPVYGNFNGFYERLLAGNAGTNTASYQQFVASKPATFFTLELGSNDALDYATSDGMTASQMLTDPNLFNVNYRAILASLTGGSKANGVVATIPDVTVLPYFHYITVPALVAAATRQSQGAFTTLYIQAFDAGGNYVTRAATNNDLMMLTFTPSQLGTTVNNKPYYGLTPNNPLPSSVVLDANEVARVQNAVNNYNLYITTAANLQGVPIVDLYALFNQLRSGVRQDGVTIGTNFLTGGVFSLDGIHLTPRGNAYLTDELIKVINTKYGSTLPALDISKYGGAGSN